MAKHVETIETYTCDFCRRECNPLRQLKIEHRLDRLFVANIALNVVGDIRQARTDVCINCVMDALNEAVCDNYTAVYAQKKED